MVDTAISSLLSSFFKNHKKSTLTGIVEERLAIYEQLDAYYMNNSLYQRELHQDYYNDTWSENMRGLRTCVNRVVEFYTAKLEPGNMPEAMPIVGPSQKVIDAITNIFLWSNMSTNKSVILRKFALYGDVFIQTVVQISDPSSFGSVQNVKVRHIFHEPKYVTDFEVDENSNIIYIRLDIPQQKGLYYTEIWDLNGVRVWDQHNKGRGADIDRLGIPTSQTSMAELGIDFVPFAHAKFRDIGEKFGNGAVTHALDKIDEANRVSTRLHEIMFRFNRPYFVALSNSMDAQGRPLPPPAFSGDALDVGDDAVIGMPGMSSLSSLVPSIQYEAALNVLKAMMDEIEKDLPEMSYFDLRGQISGVAVREMMQDACDRVVEARQNFETALIIANKHALTLGVIHGAFKDIGTYENGDFEHSFLVRDVLGMSVTERAVLLKSLSDAGVPLIPGMVIADFPPAQIDAVRQALQEEWDHELALASAQERAASAKAEKSFEPVESGDSDKVVEPTKKEPVNE